jgi:hypothetical protein
VLRASARWLSVFLPEVPAGADPTASTRIASPANASSTQQISQISSIDSPNHSSNWTEAVKAAATRSLSR